MRVYTLVIRGGGNITFQSAETLAQITARLDMAAWFQQDNFRVRSADVFCVLDTTEQTERNIMEMSGALGATKQ